MKPFFKCDISVTNVSMLDYASLASFSGERCNVCTVLVQAGGMQSFLIGLSYGILFLYIRERKESRYGFLLDFRKIARILYCIAHVRIYSSII